MAPTDYVSDYEQVTGQPVPVAAPEKKVISAPSKSTATSKTQAEVK